jgi:hypothetical protein
VQATTDQEALAQRRVVLEEVARSLDGHPIDVVAMIEERMSTWSA